MPSMSEARAVNAVAILSGRPRHGYWDGLSTERSQDGRQLLLVFRSRSGRLRIQGLRRI